jgi:ubiquinone/menaquinone biosynthesis C-methylase UbiE
VVGGIPRFTAPSSYADSFGYQWTTFRKTQLDDGARQESEETFATKTGLTPTDVAGKTVLDVGCGMGRFTDVVARWGAGTVVAMDISRAVESAQENLASFGSAYLIQGDASRPPLAPGSFDIVFSIGVLHHTPSTAASLAAVARLVKPGGTFAVWLYSSRLRLTHLGSEVLRPVTSRMDEQRLLRIVRSVVPRMDNLHERFPALTKPLRVALPTSAHPDPEWRILDTFDWYSPKYQWKHSEDEVTGWFRKLGFQDVRTLEIPVSVRGRRPS